MKIRQIIGISCYPQMPRRVLSMTMQSHTYCVVMVNSIRTISISTSCFYIYFQLSQHTGIILHRLFVCSVVQALSIVTVTYLCYFFFVIRARSICAGCTAACRLIVLTLCCSNRSHFCRQMSPCPTRHERSKQRKVEVLWVRN